jgi:Ni/Co efflux regulator RcnB
MAGYVFTWSIFSARMCATIWVGRRRAECREQRAESRGHGAEGMEQRAWSRGHGAEGREQRAWSRGQRAWSRGQIPKAYNVALGFVAGSHTPVQSAVLKA